MSGFLLTTFEAAGPVYIGEITPPEIRGKVSKLSLIPVLINLSDYLPVSFWQLFYSVGSFIAYWVNYACAKHSKTLGEWDWKMVVVSSPDILFFPYNAVGLAGSPS